MKAWGWLRLGNITTAKSKRAGLIAALHCGAMLWLASPMMALDLTFPAPAEQMATRSEARTSFRLPIGPFAGGSLPTQLMEGTLEQTAYRLTLASASTLDLIQPLRAQLIAAGFQVIFECETMACGGFDFRYGTDVLPEPDMHVDLGDFRYLAAGRDGGEVISLMVSRSGLTGFVQVTTLGGVFTPAQQAQGAVPEVVQSTDETPTAAPVAKIDLVQGLEQGLARPLDDLIFASGSSALVAGEYPSLVQLADWLRADPNRAVTLVGHTDASGGLANNIRLSKLRAESVRQRLLFVHKIAPERVGAEGVGPLSPRASNLTDEGRRKNRRVEVIMTSTELFAP